MKMKILFLLAATGFTIASAAITRDAAAGAFGVTEGLRAAADKLASAETVQFIWNGRRYCWYPGGWRGPGWYWCGYAWRRGFGWGGPAGWHGWRRPGVHRPGLNRPGINRPGGNRPGANRPSGNRPGVNRPGGNRPGVNRPGGNRPGMNRPGGNRPGGNRAGRNRSR
jgi:hypothetical protein